MNAQATVHLIVDGQIVAVPAGASVAAAVVRVAPTRFRDSVHSMPRAPLCGMGVCFECRVSIDGHPQLRACMTPVREGMQVATHD